ncbi:hypothetical protein GBA65_21560 (plasmid) [Rubrobacter marinus]|uniref:Transglutaminase-like domain-containing protein n=1 Tax=Rubrobacter marinus TaxID=2653852 RepID=A0A6G8Q3K9_9ACTN|nr:DUF3488 and transglutaminase-like domain-containing protein [Rubrobacter marinus]QIN81035.1 hypothetical protein GBA65_21560 [Rubrobacter marinus]
MDQLRVRAPLYAAGVATAAAFSTLFTGGALPVFLGAALVALLAGSSGRFRFLLMLPAAALYALVSVYGRLPLSPGGWRSLASRVGRNAYEAVGTMYAETPPYEEPTAGLLIILVPVAVVLVALATSATLYEGSPVPSMAVLGLTIGLVSTVNQEAGIGPYFALFLASCVAILLLTPSGEAGTGISGAGGGRLGPIGGLLAGVIVVGLVLALPSTPLAGAAIRPALIDWTQIGTGTTSRLAVEADVGNYLNAGRENELLRVRSEEPLLWRGGTLDYFDGARWSSRVRPGEDDGREVAQGVETRIVEQRFEVLNAETEAVFGGYRMASVSLPDAEQRPDGSWVSDETLSGGSRYRVLSLVPQPTERQLEEAGIDYPAAVRERFLQLPRGLPGEVEDTAGKIREDYSLEDATPYEKARAIERYLLYDGGFAYNLDVDYGRADRALEEFLGDGREGFCVQFATSMTLLSRELGVPSRLVYGARTGEEVGPDEYVVRGENMHTWVEIYFPEVGWYPFDPTPGFGVPSVMEANAPGPTGASGTASPGAPVPPDVDRGAGRADEPEPDGRVPLQEPADAAGRGLGVWATTGVLLPILLTLALLTGGTPLLKRALAARTTPEALYRDLTGRLEDVSWPLASNGYGADDRTLTPTERLVGAAKDRGLEVEPFGVFARIYSEHLYSAAPETKIVEPYEDALREFRKVPRWRRFLGAINPTSVAVSLKRRLAKRAQWARLRRRLRG